MDSVLAGQLLLVPPQPRRLIVPPPPPPELHGQTALVTMRVSAAGRTSLDSTVVSGIPASPYSEQLRMRMATTTFWPAVANGCAVPASTIIEFQL